MEKRGEVGGGAGGGGGGGDGMEAGDVSGKVAKDRSGAIDPRWGATRCVTGDRIKSKDLNSA